MLIDSRVEFSDGQNTTFVGATPSTSHIDLEVARQIGKGRTLWFIVQLDAVPDAGNADETYVVTLQTDDNGTFSSAATVATVTIPRGTAAGTRYVVGIPYSGVERFLRALATLGGTTPDLTFSAWITDQEPASWEALPDSLPAIP